MSSSRATGLIHIPLKSVSVKPPECKDFSQECIVSRNKMANL